MLEEFYAYLCAILYGIVEGITEWLPISSTGHLILLGEWAPLILPNCRDELLLEEWRELFDVVIQLAAVGAVFTAFGKELIPFGKGLSRTDRAASFRRLFLVLVATLPAAVVGLFADTVLEKLTGKDLDGFLYKPRIVAAALILYGVLFIVAELRQKRRSEQRISKEEITAKDAVRIGAFQVLALVPGTSRSGATMLGGETLGISREKTAKFSFLMAIPVMAGAAVLKIFGFLSFLHRSGTPFPWQSLPLLFAASAASFFVSLISMRMLLDFVKKHGLTGFGIYRIALGLIILILR